MIDAHCHLEQEDYKDKLDDIIAKCKEAGLKAVVTSCANPKDLARTLEIADKYEGYVFPVLGFHPEYIKEFSPAQIDAYIEKIRALKDRIYGIGEIGLDYNWVTDLKEQEKTKMLFERFIRLAEELNKPVIVHSRDARADTIKILEATKPKKVLWHMFNQKDLTEDIQKKGWYISIGPLIDKSKTIKKIARDMPLERIMLETDSPWFGQDGIGYPTNIKIAAENIAETKKMTYNHVMIFCARNAVKFYGLPITI